MTGNNREISGANPQETPSVKDQRDALAIDLKLKGKSAREIASATGMSLKTVQNCLSKGGRLHEALQTFRSQQTLAIGSGNLSAWEKLSASRGQITDELKQIALHDPNPAARLKAIDMILDLTGVRETEKPPLLDPASMHESCERFQKWADDLFLKTFRERAPKVMLASRAAAEEHDKFERTKLYGIWKVESLFDSWDEEDYRKRVEGRARALGKTVEEMDGQLEHFGFPVEPFDEMAEEDKPAFEKRRTERKAYAHKLVSFCKDYAVLLAHLYVEGDASALEDFKEVMALWGLGKEESNEMLAELDRIKAKASA